MASSAEEQARAALALNRKHALDIVQAGGGKELRGILEQAQRDLAKRLKQAEGLTNGQQTYSVVQLKAALHQVEQVQREVNAQMRGQLVSNARAAGEASTGATLKYLADAEKAFKGTGAQPLGLAEAKVLTRSVGAAESSVLRRISQGAEGTKGKVGILQRYGVETVGYFEKELAVGIVAKKSWDEVRQALIDKSPFLQEAPAHWAERIARTETMAAFNKAGLETIIEANEELGDMVKIITATFDDRTAADSYATHGQIRRPDEPFETWYGPMMHPPDRPNDRGSTVPHRVSWPLPKSLAWKSASDIAARWKHDGRKGSPPPRPLMTTIPVKDFGREAPKKKPP